VNAYIDFLFSRLRQEEARNTTRAVAAAAETVFAEVWENEEDAAYDHL
jgi:hypothetical protein